MNKPKITLFFGKNSLSYFGFQRRLKINEDILSPTSQVGSFLYSEILKIYYLKKLAYPQGNSRSDRETYQCISIKKNKQKIKKQSRKP